MNVVSNNVTLGQLIVGNRNIVLDCGIEPRDIANDHVVLPNIGIDVSMVVVTMLLHYYVTYVCVLQKLSKLSPRNLCVPVLIESVADLANNQSRYEAHSPFDPPFLSALLGLLLLRLLLVRIGVSDGLVFDSGKVGIEQEGDSLSLRDLLPQERVTEYLLLQVALDGSV